MDDDVSMELEAARTTTPPRPQLEPTLGAKKPFQIHRRASSKWIPPAPPLAQRMIQPLQRRFDKHDSETRYIEPNWVVSKTPRYQLRNYRKFCSNRIKTTKYTVFNFVFKNFYEQMHRLANLYFIGIVALNWWPALQAFSKYLAVVPVLIILSLTAIKDAYEDFRRHRADVNINTQTVYVWNNEFGRFRKMPWEHVIVGDLVHISNDETIPADLLLVRSSDPQGGVFVETSNLDGENNLKQRAVLPGCRGLCSEDADFDPTTLGLKIYCNQPDIRLHYVHGKVVYDGAKGEEQEEDRISAQNMVIRGCQVRNTTFIEGVVLYTGKETKAMLNNGSVPYKRSTLEKQTNVFVIFCVVLLLALVLTAGGLSIRWQLAHDSRDKAIPYAVLYTNSPLADGFINMASFIISYQILIPLSLYITVELIKLGQIFFLNQDLDMYHQLTDKRVLCRSFTIPEELGQVQYILSDKTGTLTENKMIFRFCSISGNAVEPSMSQTNTYSSAATTPMTPEGYAMSFAHLPPQPHRTLVPSANEETIDVNETLKAVLTRVAQDPHSDENYEAHYYFFLNLALCNTVMVHSEKHDDKIHRGYMEDGIFYISNSSFYVRPDEYPAPTPDESPTPASTTMNATPTPSSSRFSFNMPSIPSGPEIVRRVSSFFSKKEKGLDMKKAKNTKIYEAESPDEYCLVNAAKAYGFALKSRGINTVELTLPVESLTGAKQTVSFRIVKMLPFDHMRKRMSTILEVEGRKLLLCKGADQGILDSLSPAFRESLRGRVIISNSMLHSQRYSSDGLRTLFMAMKWVSDEEYDAWLQWHDVIDASDDDDRADKLSQSFRKMEQDLLLLGLTAVEDRLQDGVPETISALRKAGIQIWILTGDKQETALNIARSCQLFDAETALLFLQSEQDILQAAEKTGRYNIVLSPDTVKYLESKSHPSVQVIRNASAVLCYQMTPAEKALIATTVKKALKGKVLCVGDGANDVPMIQAADVGIGISGQEGLQAVMSSDFALARFSYLQKFLLVHGHWFYYRLSNVLLYFLAKNCMFVFVLFWAQFFSGFSANGIMDPLYMMLYPILFTAVQPLAYGISDQDIQADLLNDLPHLYEKGKNGTIYKSSTFFLNMLDAVWQSAAVYFIAYGAYIDTVCEAWEFGFLLASVMFLCNDLHLCLMTRCWTRLLILLHLLFIGIHYLFFLTYTSVTSPYFGTKSTPVNVAINAMDTLTYWTTLFLSVVVALFPRFFFKILMNMVRPGMVYSAALEHKNKHLAASSSSSVIPCCNLRGL